jgi:hypothetical protein
MKDIIEAINFVGIPVSIAVVIIVLFLVMQVIGEFIELSGKIVPEFFKIRKYFKRTRLEKQETKVMLQKVQQSLDEFNKHYNSDNIQQRDTWMAWVNSRAEVYDNALEELLLLKDNLKENNAITIDLYINANRNRILDFSRIAADDTALISREEFKRIYKINTEYHDILSKYNRENGEVDTAIKIINEAYDYRLRNRCFIEDIRGYNTK